MKNSVPAAGYARARVPAQILPGVFSRRPAASVDPECTDSAVPVAGQQ